MVLNKAADFHNQQSILSFRMDEASLFFFFYKIAKSSILPTFSICTVFFGQIVGTIFNLWHKYNDVL